MLWSPRKLSVVKSVLGTVLLAVTLFRITIESVIVKPGAQSGFCAPFSTHVRISKPIPFALTVYLEREGLNEYAQKLTEAFPVGATPVNGVNEASNVPP